MKQTLSYLNFFRLSGARLYINTGPITLKEFLVSRSDLKDKDLFISSLREDVSIGRNLNEIIFQMAHFELVLSSLRLA